VGGATPRPAIILAVFLFSPRRLRWIRQLRISWLKTDFDEREIPSTAYDLQEKLLFNIEPRSDARTPHRKRDEKSNFFSFILA